MSKLFLGVGIVLIVILGALVAFASRAPEKGAAGAPGKTLAPAFSLSKVGGGAVSLSEYKGKKAVILDFWATWCPNCQRDIPRQEAWYEKYKDSVEVIGVDLQEDPSTVEAFVASHHLTYPVALDPEAKAARAYDVRYTNYHVLIDKEGNLAGVVPGDIREHDFESLL